MAKHFETELASRGKPLSFKQALGVEAGSMCYKPLLTYGAQAIADCKNGIASEAFEKLCLPISSLREWSPVWWVLPSTQALPIAFVMV